MYSMFNEIRRSESQQKKQCEDVKITIATECTYL